MSERRSQVQDEPLFIVDNSLSGRTGLDYLRQWSEIAGALDIATGYFDIGALLDLDGKWQDFDRIRILMGDQVRAGTAKELLRSFSERVEKGLDHSLEDEKQKDPFLTGIAGIRQALGGSKPQIRCRVYAKDKFHAKAYITHSRFESVGSQALVGSSNFTRAGLTQNVELNIRLESSSEVSQLQEWFEVHWNDAVEITPGILEVIERHTREFLPFEVYLRSLQALLERQELGDTEWENQESEMFHKMDRYQQEGYWALLDIAGRHGGAFLSDGVGLGKTFVGLMLIERMISLENKNVVLFAPKAVRESVWEPDLAKYLPGIGGASGGRDYSRLSVLSHTDLTRKSNDYPERLRRITDMADVVVIDEAHHFRNTGTRAIEGDEERRSRYWELFDLIGNGKPKQVFMLTATPINNSLNDFKHLVELFSQEDDTFLSKSLGIGSVSGYLRKLQKKLDAELQTEGDLSDEIGELKPALDQLDEGRLFRGLVVQRSRKYAKQSQIIETGDAAIFPERQPPLVADYSMKGAGQDLLKRLDQSFARKEPLFSLAVYRPLDYLLEGDEESDPLMVGRQRQVVGLIRTNFLKRFESSVFAFERSCDRLMRKLLAFLEVHSETSSQKARLDKWKRRHSEILEYATERQLNLWGSIDADVDSDVDEDVVPPELVDKFEGEKLSRDEYDVDEIVNETFNDLDEVISLLEYCRRVTEVEDHKVHKLLELLQSEPVASGKVLVFTEFADTARYVADFLERSGVEKLVQIDSGRNLDRADVIKRFAPYYNNSSSSKLQEAEKDEIQVLVTTDVLSEGLNLQDATRIINYDIHWNPVRLMQRIGRVDRRLNPSVEESIVSDHPELEEERRKVCFWNFLPPDEIDQLLKLYSKLHGKTLRISKTLGLEEKKLLKADDDYDPLKEFNVAYEGEQTTEEELKNQLDELFKEDPTLEGKLRALPNGIFSGHERAAEGEAVFFCFELPARDSESGAYTLEAGITKWYLYDAGTGEILESVTEINSWIQCDADTPRVCRMEPSDLVSIRDRILKHIKNGYLKEIDAPVDAERPRLIGWMEVSRG